VPILDGVKVLLVRPSWNGENSFQMCLKLVMLGNNIKTLMKSVKSNGVVKPIMQATGDSMYTRVQYWQKELSIRRHGIEEARKTNSHRSGAADDDGAETDGDDLTIFCKLLRFGADDRPEKRKCSDPDPLIIYRFFHDCQRPNLETHQLEPTQLPVPSTIPLNPGIEKRALCNCCEAQSNNLVDIRVEADI
jgi:hypothetical protein